MAAASVENLPSHIRAPHLRPVQPVAVQQNGQPLVALRDPAMLRRQTMLVSPNVVGILQYFNGEHDLQAIASFSNLKVDQIVGLAQGLDRLGLLWGPTFEKYEAELKAHIAGRAAFPIRASAGLGESEEECRRTIEGWITLTADSEITGTIHGIVVPHLDYERGWRNYAAAYQTLVGYEPPERVIILGTNHFGLGDGVVLTEYGFDSPMGRCQPDTQLIEALVGELGHRLTVDQLDHLCEHSIELQIPWIRYLWGDIPVIGVLMPDPLVPMIEDNDERVTLKEFCDALRRVLPNLSATLVVASADLSHAGPQFGDPRTVDERRRTEVERHDRDMLGKYLTGDGEEFLAALRWSANPTRWCSVGNMTAALLLAQPEQVTLIDYQQSCDDAGFCLVSTAGIALHDA